MEEYYLPNNQPAWLQNDHAFHFVEIVSKDNDKIICCEAQPFVRGITISNDQNLLNEMPNKIWMHKICATFHDGDSCMTNNINMISFASLVDKYNIKKLNLLKIDIVKFVDVIVQSMIEYITINSMPVYPNFICLKVDEYGNQKKKYCWQDLIQNHGYQFLPNCCSDSMMVLKKKDFIISPTSPILNNNRPTFNILVMCYDTNNCVQFPCGKYIVEFMQQLWQEHTVHTDVVINIKFCDYQLSKNEAMTLFYDDTLLVEKNKLDQKFTINNSGPHLIVAQQFAIDRARELSKRLGNIPWTIVLYYSNMEYWHFYASESNIVSEPNIVLCWTKKTQEILEQDEKFLQKQIPLLCIEKDNEQETSDWWLDRESILWHLLSTKTLNTLKQRNTSKFGQLAGQFDCKIQKDFIFLPLLDCIGHDHLQLRDRTVKEVKNFVLNSHFPAFNTLGCVKHTIPIKDIIQLPFFGEDIEQGLYINKRDFLENKAWQSKEFFSAILSYVQSVNVFNSLHCFDTPIETSWLYDDHDHRHHHHKQQCYTIKLICNWTSTENLTKLWQKFFPHHAQQLKLTTEQQADYYVIINKPPLGNVEENITYDPKRTIVFQMEPERKQLDGNWGTKSWEEWYRPDRGKFLQVRTHDLYPNNAEWHLKYNYEELLQNKTTKFSSQKTNTNSTIKSVSCITTDQYFDPGHKKRIDFLRYIEKKKQQNIENNDLDHIFDMHIYGRCSALQFKNYHGELPPNDKSMGLLPYQYTFMAENNSEYNYFTEKIVDAILCETLCFYWGCPNLERYFPNAFIRVELQDFEQDYNIMVHTIRKNGFEKHLPAIKEAKKKILHQFQIFPTLDHIITVHNGPVLLNEFFDKIFIINLHECKDRWLAITENLQSLGIYNYERFDAININKAKEFGWPVPTFHKNRPEAPYINFEAQLACKLSHYHVIKLAKERQLKNVLVLEDDIHSTRTLCQRLNLALDEIKQRTLPWDILYLYGNFGRFVDEISYTDKEPDNYTHYCKRVEFMCSCAAYAVANHTYDLVLKEIEAGIEYPVDDIFARLIAPQCENIWAIYPWTIIPDTNNVSTIAYSNQRLPFQYDPNKVKFLCLNLERRPDRKQQMIQEFTRHDIQDKVTFFRATDAKKLKCTPDLLKHFAGNDFGSRTTFIACAISHIRMWQQLANSSDDDSNSVYLIFEDDAELGNGFLAKVDTLLQRLELEYKNWEILYLGYHIGYGQFDPQEYHRDDVSAKDITIRLLDRQKYIGGLFGYLISKSGAQRLLQYLEQNGVKQGIDVAMIHVPNMLYLEIYPHLVYSEYVDNLNSNVDSDIQRDFNCLQQQCHDEQHSEEIILFPNNASLAEENQTQFTDQKQILQPFFNDYGHSNQQSLQFVERGVMILPQQEHRVKFYEITHHDIIVIPDYDSKGYDVDKISLPVSNLLELFDNNPNIVAVNSSGWRKTQLRPIDQWQRIPKYDKQFATLVRKSYFNWWCIPPAIKALDINHNDINHNDIVKM